MEEAVVEVVLVGVFVVVLVVVLPACIIFYSVTFPHASASVLQTKKIGQKREIIKHICLV